MKKKKKKKKKNLKISLVYTCVSQMTIIDVWFLRYGARQTK